MCGGCIEQVGGVFFGVLESFRASEHQAHCTLPCVLSVMLNTFSVDDWLQHRQCIGSRLLCSIC